MALRRRRKLLRGLSNQVPGLPGAAEPPGNSGRVAGLGPVLRLTRQLRIAGSMGTSVIIGWDMGAALAMAQALGVDPLIAAECLPAIEAVMVRKLNEQMAAERGRCDEGQGLILSTNVTPGTPSKCASQVIRSALCVRAVENTMASAVANLCARQTSAAASAISVSSGTI